MHGPLLLGDESLELAFAATDGGAILSEVRNRLSGHAVQLEPHPGFVLAIGDTGLEVRQCGCRVLSEAIDEAGTLCTRVRHAATGVIVQQEVALHGPVARFRLRVYNESTRSLLLRDVTYLHAHASEPVREGANSVDLGRGDPGAGAMRRPDSPLDANPLFVGDDLFLGVDWPVAENASQGHDLECRQFPGRLLGPSETWTSRTFSIGAAPSGGVARAFVAHLDALRGRPTRRASFYFDWLLHASEGPTEQEVEATLAFLGLLRREHGVQLDLYALDDGAVETRWGLMWDRYRLQHERLFPRGLERLAQQARDLGLGLGVWLGPDVVYRHDHAEDRRAADIQWMVRTWGIQLIKLDICVSWPLTDDPYYNDRYMSRLADLYDACRAINPRLVVINHRIRFSPYMLTILDSTLWEGAESYPEVFLVNGRTPRLRTRFAAYARKAPTYFGEYSALLEDHGVCFNGDWRGWRDEFVLGVFGRALALSPEVYGTLFGLPDEEYAELGCLVQLARANRELLACTTYVPETGDFLHSDGSRALLCLVNDTWQTVTRLLRLNRDFGLDGAVGQLYRVTAHFPAATYRALDGSYTADDTLALPLLPFGVAVVEVQRVDRCVAPAGAAHGAPPLLPGTRDLGRLRELPAAEVASPAILQALEATRFAASSDTPEMQALQTAVPSRYPEVEACRAYYRDKQRHECAGICANAWDGDPATAWSDETWAQLTSNVWRIDLGECSAIGRVEVTLSQLQPGPVHRTREGTRGLEEPFTVEVSADLATWHVADAHVFYRRTALDRSYPHLFIAEFAASPAARYIRINAHGFAAQDVTVRTPTGAPLPRGTWRGNNTLTRRPPAALLAGDVLVPADVEGHVLAVICRLGEEVTVDPNSEVALAWARDGDRVLPLVDACPLLPSHRWECYGRVPGNHVVFRLPLTGGLQPGRLTVVVALFKPEVVREGWTTAYNPEVTVLCVPEPRYGT